MLQAPQLLMVWRFAKIAVQEVTRKMGLEQDGKAKRETCLGPLLQHLYMSAQSFLGGSLRQLVGFGQCRLQSFSVRQTCTDIITSASAVSAPPERPLQVQSRAAQTARADRGAGPSSLTLRVPPVTSSPPQAGPGELLLQFRLRNLRAPLATVPRKGCPSAGAPAQ